MQLTVLSRGSLLLLSHSHLLCFNSKNEFILEIWKVGHLKKKTFAFRKMKLFCKTVILSANLCSTRGYEWKVVGQMLESSLKNKLQSQLVEEMFWPADSKS